MMMYFMKPMIVQKMMIKLEIYKNRIIDIVLILVLVIAI